MIIKLAILDPRGNYIDRLLDLCRERYADRLEIAYFSAPDILEKALKEDRCDVLLVGENAGWTGTKVPQGTAFAWLTEEAYEEKEGAPAVCRYQRMDQFYREVLALYVENSGQALKAGDYLGEGAKIYAVAGANGGCGASSVAAALALSLAQRKQRVTYLDLERLGDPNLYFRGEGRETLSELIYALKSNRVNLMLRLESIVRKDPRGVRFFAAPEKPLERDELTGEELERLLQELKNSPENDAVVLDLSFGFGELELAALRAAHRVFLVSDSAYAAPGKLRRACQGLRDHGEEEILRRTALIGNRGAEPSGEEGLPVAGTLPEYTGAGGDRIPAAMAGHALFQDL